MEINSFGWIIILACVIIQSISAVASMELIAWQRGINQGLLWLVLNVFAISLPASLLCIFALSK